jgi:hypothetical protein
LEPATALSGRRAHSTSAKSALQLAVFGSMPQQPEPHFLGWADEVDADDLFTSGAAYGITTRRVSSLPPIVRLTGAGASVTMRQRGTRRN